MNAKIEYKDNSLKINCIIIPFYFDYAQKEINHSATSTTSVAIPVSLENGDVIIPKIKLSLNITLPESIATTHDGVCSLPLPYPTNIQINFHERL